MPIVHLTSINNVATAEVVYKGGNKFTIYRNEDGEIVATIMEPHTSRPEHVVKLLT